MPAAQKYMREAHDSRMSYPPTRTSTDSCESLDPRKSDGFSARRGFRETRTRKGSVVGIRSAA